MHKRVLYLFVGLIVGCGNGSDPPVTRPSITSFTANPTSPLAVGASATLAAVFTNGTGVVNPGAMAITSGSTLQVTPSASTTYTLVVTSSGGASASASATVTVNSGNETIGTDGGTVHAPDGTLVTVPFGALDAPTAISVSSTTAAPPGGIGASSPLYSFEPAGLVFARPVQVTLPLPAGVTTGSVYWSRPDGSGFDPIGGTIDATAGTISVTTAHFSQAVIGQASETRTVSGVGQITWVSATTRQNRPIDFATQGVEALVSDGEGGLVSIAGSAGTAPGTFTIPGVPTGEYILHTGTTYMVTDSNTPDLGFLRGGRPDRVLFTDSANLHITVDGLESWTDDAQLEFYSSEANDWDFVTNFWTTLAPGDTSVTFDFDVASCNNRGCAEIGPGDHAVLAQLSARTSSTGLPYLAMTRLVEFPSFSLPSGASATVTGTMRNVSQDHSMSVDFRGSQWAAVVGGGHPSAVSQCGPPYFNCFLAILGQAGSAEDGFYSANADPLTMTVDGVTDLQSGTLHYGTPGGVASGNWGLLFDVRVGGGYVPAPLPGSTGLQGALVRGLFNGIEWTTLPSVADEGPVVPPLSMIRNPQIGGQDLFTATSGVGLTPTITWTEPAIGHALFYRVDVQRLVVNAQNRTVNQGVASLITRNTSLQLPDGLLTSGGHYMTLVSAVAATSDRAATVSAEAPFKAGIDRVTTYVSSGVFTP